MTLSRALVRRVRELAQAPLPGAVEACALLHFLDAIGVGLAATGSEIGRPYRVYAETLADGGPASLQAKFRANDRRLFPPASIAALEAAIGALPRAPDLAALGAALSQPPERLPA